MNFVLCVAKAATQRSKRLSHDVADLSSPSVRVSLFPAYQGEFDRLVAAAQRDVQGNGHQHEADDGKGQHGAPQLSS